MDKSELNALFVRKLKESQERDPVRGRLLEAEIAEWASVIPAADTDSVWDALYSQIRHLSTIRKISEEQVINNLFDPEAIDHFMFFLGKERR